MRGAVLAIDLGENNIRLGMVDEDCLLSAFEKIPVERIADTDNQSLAKLEEIIRDYTSRHKLTPSAISIGFPSTLDRSRRRLQSTPNLPSFINADIVSLLNHDLDICPVYIDRDSVMLYYYDRFHFQLPHDSIIVGCYIGTGIGNVISIYGKVLYGHNGSAAELGHIPVLGANHTCVCGNTGCIEMLASGHALKALSQKLYNIPDSPDIFSEYSDHPDVDKFLEAISVTIATELNIIDPEFLVLGGRIINMAGFPRKLMNQKIIHHTRKPYPANNLKILYSVKHSDNGVKGAGLYGYARLKKDGRI